MAFSLNSPRFRAVKTVALCLSFLVGISIMAYPFVSNAIYQRRADQRLEELMQKVDEGASEDYQAELADASVYNEELVGQTVPDVFAIREGTTDEEYEAYLNVVGDQMMGSIQIPVIDVNLPIYHYSTEESLLKGCGHIFGSSLPVGGSSTHSVITAHRGLPAAKLFTDLDQLEIGDRFYLHILDQTLAYEVEHVEVVEPTETRSLAIQRGQDLVTLVTCTPYGINTDRLLVRGHRVPYEVAEETAPVAKHSSQFGRAALQVGCVLLGIGAALALSMVLQKRRDAAEADAAANIVARHGARLLTGEEQGDQREGSSRVVSRGSHHAPSRPGFREGDSRPSTPRHGKHFRG